MALRSRFLLIVVVLAVASMACSLLSGSSQPTPQASDVLFADDFSNTGSGWDSLRNDDGITDYENGGYRIQVATPDTELWANPGKNFTDVRVEVDATRQAGPEDNDFGVICRYQDVNNFYYFIVTSDGYYGIIKVQDGEMALLADGDEFGSTDAVSGGVNRIRADCVGSTLTLYLNGQQLDSRQDADFTSGDVGLIAGSYSEAGTDILFDNFTVAKP
jgi:hypothetical protein